MEEQKSKKSIIIVLVVVTLLAVVGVLFATGTISFGAKKDKTIDTNIEDNVNDNDEEDNYSPWMLYLLKQNITNINLKKVTYVDGINDTSKEVTLTIEELKSIFKKSMYYAFVKHYSIGSSLTGYGDTLTISYIASDKNYDVKISDNWISCGLVKNNDSQNLDANFLSALENTEHGVENEEFKDEAGAYYAYIFKNYTSENSIYDEFYK